MSVRPESVDGGTPHLVLTSIPEWDEEDELAEVLSADGSIAIDPSSAQAMLEQVVIKPPEALDWTELGDYVGRAATRLGLTAPPDLARHDFYLVELPVTLIVPGNRRLVRLRLDLGLSSSAHPSSDLVAYDLFPTNDVDVTTVLEGEASLDVAKAAQALVTALTGSPLPRIATCLGLKISAPFKWQTTVVKIQSSGRMSNPVTWTLSDVAMRDGFTATVILRAPKGVPIDLTVMLYGDLRERRPLNLGWWKAQVKAFEPHHYRLPAP